MSGRRLTLQLPIFWATIYLWSRHIPSIFSLYNATKKFAWSPILPSKEITPSPSVHNIINEQPLYTLHCDVFVLSLQNELRYFRTKCTDNVCMSADYFISTFDLYSVPLMTIKNDTGKQFYYDHLWHMSQIFLNIFINKITNLPILNV